MNKIFKIIAVLFFTAIFLWSCRGDVLYKDSKYWVPSLTKDEMETLDRTKNPVFKNADAWYYAAYKNDDMVGRIAVILNHLEVNEQGKKKIRFGWLDMVDDIEDYAILILDEKGKIENWNKGAQKIKGYKADEILGKNFEVFYSDEDLANDKPRKLIEVALEVGVARDEGWRIRKGGDRFWGSIVLTAIYDDQRKVIGFTKVTRDLTDLILAKQAKPWNLSLEIVTAQGERRQIQTLGRSNFKDGHCTIVYGTFGVRL